MLGIWVILEVKRGRKAPKGEGGEMQRLTIPKRVQLPFGYVVTIRQVSDSEMEEIVEDGTGESVDGHWDPDERVLYIRKSLLIRRRRYILAHDLGLAWNDWQHHPMDNGLAS